MSTSAPTFAPAPSTTFPARCASNSSDSNNNNETFGSSSSAAAAASHKATSPTHSAASSSSSSSSHSEALTNSSILADVNSTSRRNGVGQSCHDGSGSAHDGNSSAGTSNSSPHSFVGSSAACESTTAASKMSVDEPQRPQPPPQPPSQSSSLSTHDESAPMALAELSVREDSSSATPPPPPKQLAPIPGAAGSSSTWADPPASGSAKMRRASTLSSSSSSAHMNSNDEPGPSRSKGARDPTRPARRKAARMGSFEISAGGAAGQRYDGTEGDGSAIDDDGDAADTEGHHPTTTHDRMQVDLPRREARAPPISRPRSDSGTSRNLASTSRAPTPAAVSPPPPPQKHVDIVNYPSADLLRLLASLLEQIARANDALHQRHASASSSRSGSGHNTPGGALGKGGSDDDTSDAAQAFSAGRFDAAPLNSPVTPRYRRGAPEEEGEEEQGSPGPWGSASAEDMPVTPGVDLLREVGAGGGVQGFMPSLGGTHAPVPLSRRRGSSFLKSRYEEPRTGGPLTTDPTARGASASSSTHPGMNRASSSSTSAAVPTTNLAEPPSTSLLTASATALSSPSATLCFHARNIPAISIEAYLLRILKYCPTTNEVFLSLLVYFDRMARVGLEAQRLGLQPQVPTAGRGGKDAPTTPPESKMFAIDSFNVHRLVIAGVTVASKFFSDVFYTNSRYAKVGGLPLQELNQLELQFLLLNDFRLVIPVDELQRYADQLILFWVGRNGSAPSAATPALVTSPIVSSSTAFAATPTPAVTSQTTSSVASSAPQVPSSSRSTSSPGTSAPPARPTPPSRTYSGMHQQLTSHAVAAAAAAESTPRTIPSSSIPANWSSGSVASSRPQRPRSIHSQPSSSGTSVTSTITPGTPSTERHSSEGGFDSTDQGVGSSDDEAGGAGNGRRGGWNTYVPGRSRKGQDDSDDDRSVGGDDVAMRDD